MKTTAELVDEYLAKYPPESFMVHELTGYARPTLTPHQPPPARYEPPAAPRRPARGVTTMTDTTGISRDVLDQAYMELAAASGAPESLVRDAALEAAGIDPRGNIGFSSMADEVQAVSFLAGTFGLTSGATMPGTRVELSDVDDYTDSYLSDPVGTYAAAEVARLAGSSSATIKVTGRDGKVHDRYLIDPMAAEQGLLPRSPDRPELPPSDAQMTVDQALEVDRLLALTRTGIRKASYPAVASQRDRDRGTDVELADRKVDQYLELAEDGSTRTYTSNDGSVTVTEYDVTDPAGGVYTQEEIVRYLNMVAEQMGQAPLVNDSGNRSYSPPDPSTFGQRTRGPSFSGYGA